MADIILFLYIYGYNINQNVLQEKLANDKDKPVAPAMKEARVYVPNTELPRDHILTVMMLHRQVFVVSS